MCVLLRERKKVIKTLFSLFFFSVRFLRYFESDRTPPMKTAVQRMRTLSHSRSLREKKKIKKPKRKKRTRKNLSSSNSRRRRIHRLHLHLLRFLPRSSCSSPRPPLPGSSSAPASCTSPPPAPRSSPARASCRRARGPAAGSGSRCPWRGRRAPSRPCARARPTGPRP